MAGYGHYDITAGKPAVMNKKGNGIAIAIDTTGIENIERFIDRHIEKAVTYTPGSGPEALLTALFQMASEVTPDDEHFKYSMDIMELTDLFQKAPEAQAKATFKALKKLSDNLIIDMDEWVDFDDHWHLRGQYSHADIDVGCADLIEAETFEAKQLTLEMVKAIAPIGVSVVYNEHLGYSNGRTDCFSQIEIAPKTNYTAEVSAFIHEIAHFYETFDTRLTKDTCERVAESVAYIVCDYLGINHKQALVYTASFGGKPSTLSRDAPEILGIANKIINDLKREGIV
jgi:hypothetical protein